MDAALRRAYLNTDYEIEIGERVLVIKIGNGHEELDAYLMAHEVDYWAFLTAANPASQLLSNAENQKRNEELEQQLKKIAAETLPGFGRDPKGKWPGEPSFLVLGMRVDLAVELGKRFGQLAIVCGRVGEVATLMEC